MMDRMELAPVPHEGEILPGEGRTLSNKPLSERLFSSPVPVRIVHAPMPGVKDALFLERTIRDIWTTKPRALTENSEKSEIADTDGIPSVFLHLENGGLYALSVRGG